MKKKVLVWETLATVSGGQKMTLTVMDLLRDTYDFCCLIPGEGRMSEELDRRDIPYIIIGDQSLPTGVKGKSVIFRYAAISVRCIFRSLAAIRKYKPDMLYAPGPAALPWSAICGTLTGKPVIWHLHHVFLDGMTGKLLNICAKWKSVRKIIAVSECVGDQIKIPSAKDKVTVAYNPVDVDKYSAGDPSAVADEIDSILGIRPELGKTVVVSHIALVQRLKKQDITLKTISELIRSGLDVIGLFPGEVREQDFMDELRSLTDDLGIGDRVIFWGRREDVPDILGVSDVIMIPSAFEGFPLAGLEAACAGVPAVVCSTAGALEYVDVSGCGVSFMDDDPVSAAEAVRKIIRDCEDLSTNGRVFAEKCSVNEYARKINEAFGQL